MKYYSDHFNREQVVPWFPHHRVRTHTRSSLLMHMQYADDSIHYGCGRDMICLHHSFDRYPKRPLTGVFMVRRDLHRSGTKRRNGDTSELHK